MHNKFIEVGFIRQVQAFSESVAACFHTSDGDVHQAGDFFGTEVHAQVCAQFIVILAEFGKLFSYSTQKIDMYLIEVLSELLPVFIQFLIEVE